jgi:hypothetical protein
VCYPDSPQGLSKKIQFQLLLADLALQHDHPLARRRKIRHPLRLYDRVDLDRPEYLVWPVRWP